jgi:hypothetical protein
MGDLYLVAFNNILYTLIYNMASQDLISEIDKIKTINDLYKIDKPADTATEEEKSQYEAHKTQNARQLKQLKIQITKYILERIKKYYSILKLEDVNTHYISNYGKAYVEYRENTAKLEAEINTLISQKIIIEDLITDKIPVKPLFIEIKETNIRKLSEPFLLKPSYVGHSVNEPNRKYFRLPSYTVLNKDELKQTFIEIEKEQLLKMYKIKVMVDQYALSILNLEEKTKECVVLSKIMEDFIKDSKFYITEATFYENFIFRFKEEAKEFIETNIGKPNTIYTITNIISNDLLNPRRHNPLYRTSYIFNIEDYPQINDEFKTRMGKKLNKTTLIQQLTNNTLDRTSKIKIIKYITDNYHKFNNTELDKINMRVSQHILLNFDTPITKEEKDIIDNYKMLVLSPDEALKESKKQIENLTLDNAETIINIIKRIHPNEQKQIYNMLDAKIMREQENATDNDTKNKWSSLLIKSINEQETLTVLKTVDSDKSSRGLVLLNTELKEKIKNNKIMIVDILKNINKYIPDKQTTYYNFKYDVDTILQIEDNSTLNYLQKILNYIIDINIQMDKIRRISTKPAEYQKTVLFENAVDMILQGFIKGKNLMVTRDFFFKIKDVKWSPRVNLPLGQLERISIPNAIGGLNAKGYKISISLVLSIDGQSDTSVVFQRKCDEHIEAISSVSSYLYGEMKDKIDNILTSKAMETCKEIKTVEDMKRCVIPKVTKSIPLDIFYTPHRGINTGIVISNPRTEEDEDVISSKDITYDDKDLHI